MSEIKKLYKYPEIGKLERELDQIIKFLNDNNITINELKTIVNKLQQQSGGSGITIVGEKYPPVDADKFIFQDSVQSFQYVTITWQQLKSFFALASHNHSKSQITDLNEGLVGTKDVNESAIGNNKILFYNSTSDKLEYKELKEGLVGTKDVDESAIGNNKILFYNSVSGKLEYKILNEGLVGTKDVDESAIGNNKILVYNSTTGKLEYQTNSSSPNPVIGNVVQSALAISTSYVDLINKTASIVAGDFLYCEVYGRAYNNSGSNRTFRIRLDFGGSLLELIAPAALTTANYSPIRVMFTISVLSASETIVTGYWTQIAALGSGVSAALSGAVSMAWLSIAANRTGSQTIKIQMMSSGTGTQDFSGGSVIRRYGAA